VLTGECLCKSVRFEIDSKLGPVIYCHCSMCRRGSGSAFASNASVDANAFRIAAGEEHIAEYQSSPGNFRAFCSRCGSLLYGRMDAYPQIRRVRLGSLADDPGRRSIAHIWVGSKSTWFEITDKLEQFEEEPPAWYCSTGTATRV
jgi:hypothetical protein